MQDEPLDGEQAERLREACRTTVSDQQFRRSPTLAKLLSYLVEKTVIGESERLKSFTIATEGLGRSRALDVADAYARVQIARLRKALATYQSKNSEHDCLTIVPGDYTVHLIPGSVGSTAEAEVEDGASLVPPAQPSSRLAPLLSRPHPYLLGALILVALFVWVFVTWKQDEAAELRWKENNFPTVSVSVHRVGVGYPASLDAQIVRRDLLVALSQYDGVRASTDRPAQSDYSLQLDLARHGPNVSATQTLIDVAKNQLVWSRENESISAADNQVARLLGRTAFMISSTSGVLTTYELSNGHTTDNPYGCWLRFAETVQLVKTSDDERFETCAAEWHAAAPNDPIAEMLYGWSLTSQSIRQLTDDRRLAMLDAAISVLIRASVVNRSSAPLRLAAMRAYSFKGEASEMEEAGRDALALNPASPDVRALVGMTFVFWDVPEGEQLLLRALEGNPSPPPWYHVGLAVKAMMRNDPASEKLQLAKIAALCQSQPMLQILFAAYEAKIGDAGKARQYLEAPPFQGAFGHVPLQSVLRRLPIAPSVRARLEEWLAPIM